MKLTDCEAVLWRHSHRFFCLIGWDNWVDSIKWKLLKYREIRNDLGQETVRMNVKYMGLSSRKEVMRKNNRRDESKFFCIACSLYQKSSDSWSHSVGIWAKLMKEVPSFEFGIATDGISPGNDQKVFYLSQFIHKLFCRFFFWHDTCSGCWRGVEQY